MDPLTASLLAAGALGGGGGLLSMFGGSNPAARFAADVARRQRELAAQNYASVMQAAAAMAPGAAAGERRAAVERLLAGSPSKAEVSAPPPSAPGSANRSAVTAKEAKYALGQENAAIEAMAPQDVTIAAMPAMRQMRDRLMANDLTSRGYANLLQAASQVPDQPTFAQGLGGLLMGLAPLVSLYGLSKIPAGSASAAPPYRLDAAGRILGGI